MGEDAEAVPEKQKWIEQVGTYRYYSHVLAHFNPAEAEVIYDMPADLITAAFVSKLASEFRPKPRK